MSVLDIPAMQQAILDLHDIMAETNGAVAALTAIVTVHERRLDALDAGGKLVFTTRRATGPVFVSRRQE